MARPRTPLISRESAAMAALAIIDDHGVEGLTVERLANTLQVKAPSLYHHFKGRSDILSEVARLVVTDVTIPPDPARGDWIEWFVEFTTRYRKSVLRHPRAAPLLLQLRPRHFGPGAYEVCARTLTLARVPERLHAFIFHGLDIFVTGSAMFEAAREAGQSREMYPEINSERYPLAARAMAANEWDDERMFQEAVRHFLVGTAALSTPVVD